MPEQTTNDNAMPSDSGYGPGAALASNTSSLVDAGYIEPARIANRVRVRYDNMNNANAPTRGDFMFPTSGFFGGPGPFLHGPDNDPTERDFYNIKEISTYVEAAYSPCFSVFGEFSVRQVEWSGDDTIGTTFAGGDDQHAHEGFGDIKAGLRYGLIACPDEALTWQIRAYAPTGDAREGLGVGHPSIDTSLLYEVRTSDRLTFFGEITDWQSIDAGSATTANAPSNNPNPETVDLNSNILRYGVGVGYDIYQTCDCRPSSLTAIFEVVGWTVLDGEVTATDAHSFGSEVGPAFTDAAGQTIVNGKYGLRYNWSCTKPMSESLYVGFGTCWTEERWYKDLFRLELTHNF